VAGVVPTFDGQGRVTALRFVPESASVPGWLVLGYTAPGAGKVGALSLEALALGAGNGRPGQALTVEGAPVQQESLAVWALEPGGWRRWEARPDLDASGRADRHFQLDPTRGVLAFGDGERGLAPPAGARFLARCRLTRAGAGNLAAGTAYALPDSPHDRALLPGLDAARVAVTAIAGVEPGVGGAAAETIDHASDRAADAADSSPRAITLADYEALALGTPGTHVARARALGGLHPSFHCFRAIGMVTVLVVPDLPGARPAPSPGLLATVKAGLGRRRALGTRVEVVGPGWVEVAVRAALAAAPGVDPAKLQQRAADRLDAFFDPRLGGPDGTGWPFGREVARAEVMQVLNQVPGVAHVRSLDFLVNGCDCDPQCGNVCLRPTELVAAGAHQIQVS
jgi:predicted phage baseplate assembly protein